MQTIYEYRVCNLHDIGFLLTFFYFPEAAVGGTAAKSDRAMSSETINVEIAEANKTRQWSCLFIKTILFSISINIVQTVSMPLHQDHPLYCMPTNIVQKTASWSVEDSLHRQDHFQHVNQHSPENSELIFWRSSSFYKTILWHANQHSPENSELICWRSSSSDPQLQIISVKPCQLVGQQRTVGMLSMLSATHG